MRHCQEREGLEYYMRKTGQCWGLGDRKEVKFLSVWTFGPGGCVYVVGQILSVLHTGILVPQTSRLWEDLGSDGFLPAQVLEQGFPFRVGKVHAWTSPNRAHLSGDKGFTKVHLSWSADGVVEPWPGERRMWLKNRVGQVFQVDKSWSRGQGVNQAFSVIFSVIKPSSLLFLSTTSEKDEFKAGPEWSY